MNIRADSVAHVESRSSQVFNLEGELLNHHKHYTNFLGEPIGSNSCLALHPFLPHLATGSLERIVSVYAPGR